MLKKLLSAMLSAALLMSASTSFAQPGVYLGAALGANQGSWSVRDNKGNNYGFGTRGAIGTLLAGYAFNADHFYLGVEGFATEASNKSGTKAISNTVTRYIRQTYSYGLGVLPGFIINDGAIVFARVGAVRSHFQVRDSSPSLTVSNAPTQTGAQVGAGIQMAISQGFDLRGEYVYSTYNSYSNTNGRFTPRDSQVNLGVIYRLG